MIHPKEKKERSLGEGLSLKGYRCASPKCALVRRPFRPGVHKRLRRPVSEYGLQLREKQKLKLSYGVTEKQLQKIFANSDNPFRELERRLDNIVFRLGIAPSRMSARQYISHGHILVNGRRITSPSYAVKIEESVSVRPESWGYAQFSILQKSLEEHNAPEWLLLNGKKLEGTVRSYPNETDTPINTSLVVEFYSK